jgi:hypothetical protein
MHPVSDYQLNGTTSRQRALTRVDETDDRRRQRNTAIGIETGIAYRTTESQLY